MPPKNAAIGADTRGEDITVLCHLIMSCDEFKADNSKLAPIMNIAQAKNVPRKINSIIGPYGFELKSGKMIVKEDVDGATVPATPKAMTVEDGDSGPKTPASLAKKRATPRKNGNATPKTPRSKKRKIVEAIDDDDTNTKSSIKDEDDVDTEDKEDGGVAVKSENDSNDNSDLDRIREDTDEDQA